MSDNEKPLRKGQTVFFLRDGIVRVGTIHQTPTGYYPVLSAGVVYPQAWDSVKRFDKARVNLAWEAI